MELKVIYRSVEKIDMELDKKIEVAFDALGFKRWASGYDLTNGERDLAFDNKK